MKPSRIETRFGCISSSRSKGSPNSKIALKNQWRKQLFLYMIKLSFFNHYQSFLGPKSKLWNTIFARKQLVSHSMSFGKIDTSSFSNASLNTTHGFFRKVPFLPPKHKMARSEARQDLRDWEIEHFESSAKQSLSTLVCWQILCVFLLEKSMAGGRSSDITWWGEFCLRLDSLISR